MGKIGAIFFVFLGLVLALALFQAPALALCWDCNDNNYETADRQEYCDCDEWEKCKDIYVKSTAYEFSGTDSSGTDYCSDSQTLMEAYIDCYAWDEIKWYEFDCDSLSSYDPYEYYCSGDSIYKHRIKYDYDCSNGRCFYDGAFWVDDTFVKNCNDDDGWYCDPGNVKEYRDYYCSGGSCYHTDSNRYDCDNYDGWVCDGETKKYRNGYCSDGSCYTEYTDSYDCNNDNYYGDWVYYCSGNDRRKHRKYYDYYCSGGNCYSDWSWTNDQFVETCYYGCSGGACNPSPIITFRGTVKYYDQRENKYRVLPGAKVELWDKDAVDDDHIATGETNSLGKFRFDNIDTDSYDYGRGDAADIYVNVVMESSIVAVSEAWNPTIINHESSVYYDVLEDKDITINIGSSSSPTYHPESAAANVMDVIRTAYLLYKSYDSGWSRSQIFVELHDEDSWICRLLAGIGIGSCSGAHFELSFKDEIHLYGDNIWSDSTIAHEYSHAVMYEAYGNEWPSMPVPYGDYLKDYNFIGLTGVGETVNGHIAFMESGLGFAIIEGWAEFMEAVDYGNSVHNPLYDSEIELTAWCTFGFDFDNNSAIEKYDAFHEGSTLEDNKWWMGDDAFCYSCSDSNCGGTEQWKQEGISNPNGNTGDIVEGAVASIFWDIYDSDNSDELGGNGISNGLSKIWSIIRKDHPDDILEFWSHWFSTSDNTPTNYGDFNKLACIYEMHGIDKCPDSDRDGYDDEACCGEDCDDGDNSIYPGATELCDGIDSNCDGIGDEVDDDGDGLLNCNDNCPNEGYSNLPGDTTCRDWYLDYTGCHAYNDAPTSTVCGTKDCNNLDTICRDYHDVNRYCDGSGGCGSGTCNSYTNTPLGTPCGTGKECDGNGNCVDICTDECSSGQTQCSGSFKQTCGDYDEDYCLEFPSSTTGPGNEECICGCQDGQCIVLEGDVGGNGAVDIFDLAAVGICYGQSASEECENADLSGDGKINIFDLATVGLNYGRSC